MPHSDQPPARTGLLAMLDAVWPSWALSALDHPAIWEWQIRQYERRDRRSTPLRRGILFTGSSSINLWSSLAEDMAPLPVLNRGFGGAHLDHVIRYANRVVLPYRPRLIVLYAGENDLSGWSRKTPETVTADFEHFVELVHGELADTHLLYLSVKPSLLRRGLADVQHELNDRIAAVTAGDERLGYLDVATPLLDAAGVPRRELFRLDRLHLNDAGYRVWTTAIRPAIERTWNDLTRSARGHGLPPEVP
jgi:lysophospholipase L1-like esterase